MQIIVINPDSGNQGLSNPAILNALPNIQAQNNMSIFPNVDQQCSCNQSNGQTANFNQDNDKLDQLTKPRGDVLDPVRQQYGEQMKTIQQQRQRLANVAANPHDEKGQRELARLDKELAIKQKNIETFLPLFNLK